MDVLQPTIAIILGARDGVKEVRAGGSPFLSALVFLRTGRREFVRAALASVRDLVAVAILPDSRLTVAHLPNGSTPGSRLLLGQVLIAAPYAFSRAAANRIARWRNERLRTAERNEAGAKIYAY